MFEKYTIVLFWSQVLRAINCRSLSFNPRQPVLTIEDIRLPDQFAAANILVQPVF